MGRRHASTGTWPGRVVRNRGCTAELRAPGEAVRTPIPYRWARFVTTGRTAARPAIAPVRSALLHLSGAFRLEVADSMGVISPS